MMVVWHSELVINGVGLWYRNIHDCKSQADSVKNVLVRCFHFCLCFINSRQDSARTEVAKLSEYKLDALCPMPWLKLAWLCEHIVFSVFPTRPHRWEVWGGERRRVKIFPFVFTSVKQWFFEEGWAVSHHSRCIELWGAYWWLGVIDILDDPNAASPQTRNSNKGA